MKLYRIISYKEIAELEKEVVTLLNAGWALVGGIAMAYNHEHSDHHIPGHLIYVQALEKNE